MGKEQAPNKHKALAEVTKKPSLEVIQQIIVMEERVRKGLHGSGPYFRRARISF